MSVQDCECRANKLIEELQVELVRFFYPYTEYPKIYRKSVLHLLKYAIQICGKFWDTQYDKQQSISKALMNCTPLYVRAHRN